MAWVKLDDKFATHPKLLKAGPLGLAMHVAALCYCNRHLTDGFIPRQAASTLLDLTGLGMRMWDKQGFGGGEDANCKLVIDDIVAAGLWEIAEDGWQIHDYLDYQPSKLRINSIREKRKNAGSKGGYAKALANSKGVASVRSEHFPSKRLAKVCPVPVPVSQEVREEKETHQEVGKEKEIGADAPSPPSAALPLEDDLDIHLKFDRTEEGEAIKAWNELASTKGLSLVRRVTTPRRVKLRLRLEECGGLSGWREALGKIEANKFLLGENDRGWRADFDFLLQQKSFTKLMEGGYERGKGAGRDTNTEEGDRAAIVGALAERLGTGDDDAPLDENGVDPGSTRGGRGTNSAM